MHVNYAGHKDKKDDDGHRSLSGLGVAVWLHHFKNVQASFI